MAVNMDAQLQARHTTPEAAGRDVFVKCEQFVIPRQLRKLKMLPYYMPLEANEGPVAVIEGKGKIMLGSNNYLGLTTDPRVREAAARAIHAYGPSLTGSRLLNGSMRMHEELEHELADFVGKEDALVFATGYQANLGVISGLLNEDCVAVIDKFDHASIHDGVRMSRCRSLRYAHNDFEELDRLLAELGPECGPLVIVDGVFSMEGDIADLPALAQICKRRRARLMADDAHGIGVLGPGGRGTAAHHGCTQDVDIIVGTFSKSLASVGGFVASRADVIDYIRFWGRSIVFSASLPPASCAAARTALGILKAEPERVDRLRDNADRLRNGLKSLGFDTGVSATPIIPVVIGNDMLTIRIWKELLEAGVYTNPIVHPAVPKDRALLRTSVMATHEPGHIDQALELLAKVGRKFRVIS